MVRRKTNRGIALDGQKLYDARLAKRMSADELGELCGVTGGHIRYVERGSRKVSVDLLAQLERVLEVTAKDLGADVPDFKPPRTTGES